MEKPELANQAQVLRALCGCGQDSLSTGNFGSVRARSVSVNGSSADDTSMRLPAMCLPAFSSGTMRSTKPFGC